MLVTNQVVVKPQVSVALSNDDDPKTKTEFRRVDITSWSHLAEIIRTHVWSGILWADNLRKQSNFEAAHFAVCDIDDGATIKGVLEYINDPSVKLGHIIAPTKSHLVAKGGKPPRDRFRLIFRFSEPVTCLRQYKQNIAELCDIFLGDKACTDGARFFYPSLSTPHVRSGSLLPLGAVMPYDEPQEDRQIIEQRNRSMYENCGRLPRWLEDFLYRGKLIHRGGRNNSIFAAALELKKLGLSETQIVVRIEAAPISKENLTDREIRTTIRSALR